MDDKTAKAVKALGINAKNEEDARNQILEILKKNEIEGMEDEELSTLIDIAEALVSDSKEDSEEDENDKLANEVDEEDVDDEGDEDDSEEEDVEEDGDELDNMDRSELKAYIKEHELDVKVTKKMEDDDIREAIRAAEAENDDEGDDEQENELEPEPEEKPAKGKKAEKKAAKKAEKEEEEEPAEKPNKKADKKAAKAEKAEKKSEKKEKKEGGRKKTKIDPKNNNEDRKVFDMFKELFPEDRFNYNWVEGGVTIKHRGENSERGIVCMKPFYRKENGLVGNMYIAVLTKNTDVLDKNDIDYDFHWNNAPEMKNITIDEAYEILEKVQDEILEKVQRIDKKLGDNKVKMEKNLEKSAKKDDVKASEKSNKKADKKNKKK